MAMTLVDISQWLEDHRLLVISVVVPLFSALVAALAAWYSTRRTLKTEQEKMQLQTKLKVNEFRQNWINDLRDTMAEFQSYAISPDADPAQEREFYRLGTKVELLMNPRDPDFEELQELMYAFLHTSTGDINDKYSHNTPYVSLCQRILKREWERLKSDLKEN